MNDDEIERLLQQYAPVGPPDRLRHRIVAASVDSRRAWPWLVAAGVLLCVTIGAQVASVRVHRDIAALMRPEIADSALTELEEALGGGPEARQTAEQMILERAIDRARETEQAVGTAGTNP